MTVRNAGLGDEEILANAVLTILANYENHVGGIEIDFPVAIAKAVTA